MSIDADVGFMDFKATMNCDQTNDDNNGDDQIPSYLYDADKENNNNNRQRKLDDENNYYQEAEAELSECCREVLENSIGCFGGLFGYYSLEMEQQCETVQQVLDCTSSNSEGCGFSNIDLNGENYLAEEGSGVMKVRSCKERSDELRRRIYSIWTLTSARRSTGFETTTRTPARWAAPRLSS